MPGMRFAGTRNTFRWSLDASDELGLMLCFTVPPTATVAAPTPAVPAAAPSPFRAPFLVCRPLPLPLPTEAGGLKSVVVVAPSRGAPVVTGVVAEVVWLWVLAEGTRLSGEVVHFNSMTFCRGRPLLKGVLLLLLLLFRFVCTTINKLFLAFPCAHSTHLRLNSSNTLCPSFYHLLPAARQNGAY